MSTAARVFSIIDMEDGLQELARGVRPPAIRERGAIEYAPPAARLPNYLEHRDGADDIGRLSAEAVASAYEAAAREVEQMGEELKQRTQLCEKMVADSNQALALVRETAAQIRDAGKAIFLRIEDATMMMQEVRATCDTLRVKIAAPSS